MRKCGRKSAPAPLFWLKRNSFETVSKLSRFSFISSCGRNKPAHAGELTGSAKRDDEARPTQQRLDVRTTRRAHAEHPEVVGGASRRRRPPVAGPLARSHALGQRHPVAERSVLDQVAADGDGRRARQRRKPGDEETVAMPPHAHVVR